MTMTSSVPASAPSLFSRTRSRLRGQGDILWSFVDQALVSGSSFLTGVAAARLLHLAGFGRFAFVIVTAVLVGTLQYFLTTAPLLARGRGSDALRAGQATLILGSSVAGGIIAAALVGLLLVIRDGHADPALLAVSAFLAMGQNLHDGARYMLFARRMGRQAVMLDAVRYGALGTLIALAVVTGQAVSPIMLLVLLGLCAFVPGLAALTPALRQARSLPRLMPVLIASNWRSARWLVLMVLVTTSLEQITYMATAATLGDEAVGALRIGLYCLGVYGLVLVTLEKIVPRRAADALRAGGKAGLKRFLARAALMAGVPSLVLVLAGALTASFWLERVFGPGASAHADLAQWASVGFAFTFLREFAMVYLRTIGETRPIFLSFCVSTSLALIGLWPAGHMFGLTGLAAMLAFAHAVSCLLILRAAHRA